MFVFSLSRALAARLFVVRLSLFLAHHLLHDGVFDPRDCLFTSLQSSRAAPDALALRVRPFASRQRSFLGFLPPAAGPCTEFYEEDFFSPSCTNRTLRFPTSLAPPKAEPAVYFFPFRCGPLQPDVSSLNLGLLPSAFGDLAASFHHSPRSSREFISRRSSCKKAQSLRRTCATPSLREFGLCPSSWSSSLLSFL